MSISANHTKIIAVLFFYLLGSYSVIGKQNELVEKYLKRFSEIAYEKQDSALYYLEQAKIAAIGNPDYQVSVYFKFSDFYIFVNKDLEKSLQYLAKAKALATKVTSIPKIAGIYNRTGYVLYIQGHYKESIDSYKKAIEILKKDKNDKVLNNSYIKFAGVLIELELFEEATIYFQKSLDLANENHEISKSYIYLSMAKAYIHKQDYDDAEMYLQKALKIVADRKPSRKKQSETIMILTQIAKVYYLTKKYEKALMLALECEEWIKNLKKTKKNVGAHLLLGQIYYELENDKLALQYAEASYQKLEKTSSSSVKYDCVKLLAMIYERLGDYKKALEFSKLYQQLNLQSLKAEIRQDFFKEKYQNELQEKDEKALHEAQIKKLQIALIISFSVGMLLIGYMLHKKRKQVLLKRVKEKEVANTRMQKRLYVERKKAIQIQNELDAYLRLRSSVITTENGAETIQTMVQKLHDFKILTEDDWLTFKLIFQKIYPNFFKNFKVNVNSYSMGDLKLASLIRLNFNTKETAKILAISPESVRKGKYRLRKKMMFTSEKALQKFIYTL